MVKGRFKIQRMVKMEFGEFWRDVGVVGDYEELGKFESDIKMEQIDVSLKFEIIYNNNKNKIT